LPRTTTGLEVLVARMVSCCQVITFDSHGVSGHPNHVALYSAMLDLVKSRRFPNLQVWALESTPLWRKYLGVVDLLLSWLLSYLDPSILYLPSPQSLWFTFAAMRAHWSQLVWYRLLFVISSRYSYVNTLRRIKEFGA
jgi:N-acetylglucosaminylphosphatidylinositol deacetylase